MPTTRSYNNAFEVVDYTAGLQVIPTTPTLMGDLGLFSVENLTGRTVTFEEKDGVLNLLTDRHRGEKPQTLNSGERVIRSYPVAHFPWTDTVWPGDVAGKRAYGTDAVETIEAKMVEKSIAASKAMDLTLEAARMSTIVTGKVYAPNGTIAGDFYSDFGKTRKDIVFSLSAPTTEIISKGEEAIAHIQDNAENGALLTRIVALCSPEFFGALIVHPMVKTAYQFYKDGEQPLRNRVGGMARRQFEFGGVLYIEVREKLNGTGMIPAGEARILPTGLDDAFKTYFSPAETLDLVNTVAVPKYLFSFKDPKGRHWDLDGETNFINVLRRPQVIVRATVS